LKLLRPAQLLFISLAYALGAAIADFLGIHVDSAAFLLGLIYICLAHVSMILLNEVFRPANEPLNNLFGAERVYLRDRLLFISIGLLAISAGCAYFLFLSGRVTRDAFIFLCLSLFIVLTYAVPPFRLSRKGFGEFFQSAQIGYVVPSLAFTLQADKLDRLVPLFALPITALVLAYFLIQDFATFAEDIKYERLTFLTRLGWQRAVPLHHSLIVLTFGSFAVAPLLGLPLSLMWPVFLALPFAILQIILLQNIARGAPPLWRPLTILSAILFALTTYFLAFSFFLR